MFNVWVGPVHALVRDRLFCSGRSWIGSLRFRFGISWLNFKSVRLWITEGLHHYTLFFFKLTAGSLIIMMVWNMIFSLQHPSSCFRRRNPPWVHVFLNHLHVANGNVLTAKCNEFSVLTAQKPSGGISPSCIELEHQHAANLVRQSKPYTFSTSTSLRDLQKGILTHNVNHHHRLSRGVAEKTLHF